MKTGLRIVVVMVLGLTGLSVWAALPPDTLHRQLRVLNNIASRVEHLEQSSAQYAQRISQYQSDVQMINQTYEKTQQRYLKLKGVWADYFQSFVHQYYQKLWQMPVLFNLEERRQSARSLWAATEFSGEAWQQLSSVKDQLKELQAQKTKWEEFKGYFEGLGETLTSKKEELKALVQIQQKVMSDTSVWSGLSKELQKVLSGAYHKVYFLKQRLSEKFDPSRIDVSHLYVVPVLSQVYDTDFMKPVDLGVQFKAVPREPISAVESGTVKTVSEGEQRWDVTVEVAPSRHYMLSGLGQVFVREGDEIKKNEIAGVGPDQPSWVSVYMYEYGQPMQLTQAHFFSMKNTF